MSSLASHCYDVLKEQGAYDNFQKKDEIKENASENFNNRANVESGGTVPYFPYPEIIEDSERVYYLYPHEPDIEFFKGASNLHPLGDS